MGSYSVTVFCGSSPGVDPAYAQAAAAMGEGSALRAGAHVTGVIPDFLRQREVEFPGLSELIVTDSMHTRKRRLFALGDAFVVLPGGLGAFDETFEILTWKQLGRHDKPIILVDILGWAQPFAALIAHAVGQGFARPSAAELFEVQPDVPATLARLESLRGG